MAFIRVEPVEVQVRTNWFSGRPRDITWGNERLPITRLAVVREEAAAYPVITGLALFSRSRRHGPVCRSSSSTDRGDGR